MTLRPDTVLTKIPKFTNLGLLSVHTLDELRSVFVPTTRIRRTKNGYNWISPGYIICEVTANRVSRTRSDQNFSAKLILKLGGEIIILVVKIIIWVDHLLTWQLLIQTQTTHQCHQLTWFQCKQKHQSLCHWLHKKIWQHHQQIFQSKIEKCTFQWTWIQTLHHNIYHQKNLNCRMRAIPVNQSKIKSDNKKRHRGNKINNKRQTHHQDILIRLTIVTTYASSITRRATVK